MAMNSSGAVDVKLEKRYRFLVLIVLCLVYALNFLDRQLLAILAQPIKTELNLTDTQLGMLGGLTFALFYTVMGIPVALLADRTNRVRVVAASCALWSVFTAACGFSYSLLALTISRIGVGIGEAGGTPPSHSIISDYYPPSERGSAIAIYSLGVPIGITLGAALGGWIAASFGWRAAFISIGVAGLITAPLVLFVVKEPPRGRFDDPATKAVTKARLWDTARFFFSSPVLALTALCSALAAFVAYAVLSWAPAYLMREKGMSLTDISLYYSLLLGVSAGAGTWISGYLVDRLGRKSPGAYALVPGIAALLCIPFLMGLVYAPNWQVAVILLTVPIALSGAALPPSIAIVQNGVAPHQRATASAMLLFVTNLIGNGCGPLFVGALSDGLGARGAADPLGSALLALAPVCAATFLIQCVTARYLIRGRRETAAYA